jgi:hypothetical protein
LKLTDLYFSIFHKIQIIYYLLIVYKFFFSETSCDFNECIQGCPYVKIGLNQGCSEACKKNQTFQKNTTCVDLCKKTSQQFMTSIIGRDLFLLAFLGGFTYARIMSSSKSWIWRQMLKFSNFEFLLFQYFNIGHQFQTFSLIQKD